MSSYMSPQHAWSKGLIIGWLMCTGSPRSLQIYQMPTWLCHCNGFECVRLRFHIWVYPTASAHQQQLHFSFTSRRRIRKCLPCSQTKWPFLSSFHQKGGGSCLQSHFCLASTANILQLTFSLHIPLVVMFDKVEQGIAKESSLLGQ